MFLLPEAMKSIRKEVIKAVVKSFQRDASLMPLVIKLILNFAITQNYDHRTLHIVETHQAVFPVGTAPPGGC